ncbi:uncharacterized protein JCM10292_001737 [Rhodotorula paludigena]|uniref:uncharacterized protein n=1 Tax=Rhodotorula paludigena TaxID=86838 RepID=UPI003171FADB
MHDAADDPLPRADSASCTSPGPLDGDTRMRGMSEEPTSAPVNIASPATNGHALTQSPSSSLHRSASASTAPSGATVQRNPSLRARDAFSRLRIGSAGSSPRPAVPPPPPASSSSPSASPAAAQTANPKPPTRAASFLSAFSPPSSVGSGGGRSPSPPLASTSSSTSNTAASSAAAAPTAPRRAFPPLASIALPPRGDEQGFVLRTRDERGTEWEVELGRELGRGGMGTVRETVRRRVKGKRRARRGEDEEEMRDDDDADEGRESDEEEDQDEDDVRALAVKIIPRANPYFVKLDRAALALGAGASASSDLAQAAGGPSASAGVAANPHLQGLVHHLHPSPCPTPPAPLAPLASLEPGQSARHPSSRDRVRLVGERARSASSPFAASRPGLGSRAASLATVQGTPRVGRSPESEEAPGVEVLGSSAPGRGDGFFAAAAAAAAAAGLERGGKGGEGGEGAATAAQDGNNDDDDEEPVDLLDLLLQREISIWRQLSALPSPFANPAHRTRWTGRGGHPHIVALVDTHRSADYDYVFMPLAEGGTLFEYVTDPRVRARQPQPAASASSSSSSARGRSKSRSRPRPRASIPIAGTAASSLSPPPPTTAGGGAGAGIGLAEAGEFFVQLADAVRWMHDVAGVAHRDLKLENVVGCWEVPSSSSASVRKGKARRVWKLADFGLAEVIPAPAAAAAAAPAPAPAPAVQGVQPLSALARAGSLHRGPSGSSAGDAAQPASAGPMSQSAFLPAPHRTVGSPAPAPGPGPAVPHNSPLSALLHPVGSLPYSSPEALRSSVPIVHPSGDIWALGCVLYAMIAGRLPIWEEWELRLRVRLMKGDWDVPDELDPAQAVDAGDRDERALALDVLRGCLDKDVDRRWTIRRVCESAWVARVRERVAVERERERHLEQAARDGRDGGDRTRLDSLRRERDDNLSPLPAATPTATGASSPTTTTTTTGGRTPSRGRLPTRTAYAATNGGPPPAPSAGKSTDPSPDGGSGGASSSSAAAARQKSTSRSRTRLATRSSSRSSAYAHQFGPASDEADRERRERGRSERRLRWDEAGGAGAGSARRRSSSRASSSTSASVAALENGGGAGAEQQQQQQEPASGPRRGRSASRRRQQREEWERDERERQRQREGHGGLATVGEPY